MVRLHWKNGKPKKIYYQFLKNEHTDSLQLIIRTKNSTSKIFTDKITGENKTVMTPEIVRISIDKDDISTIEQIMESKSYALLYAMRGEHIDLKEIAQFRLDIKEPIRKL